MIIKNLRITNFRNISEEIVEFQKGITLIWGGNGQGKTNLLEAIYLLSGRPSFRGAQDNDLKKEGENGYYIAGVFEEFPNENYQVEVGYENGRGKKIKQQGKEIRKKIDLLLKVPITLFFPGDLKIIQGEPSARRRFLDNIFLQVSSQHRRVFVNYYRALMQRNSLLKRIREGKAASGDLSPWNRELIKWGRELTVLREKLLLFMEEQLKSFYPEMSGEQAKIKVEYLPSLLDEANLEKHFEDEKRRGYTLLGPQVEDFEIYLNNRKARINVSQGEQKLLSLCLRWGEALFLREQTGPPIFLMDDALSSLDSKRKSLLLKESSMFSQVFITHTDNLNHHFSASYQIIGGSVV